MKQQEYKLTNFSSSFLSVFLWITCERAKKEVLNIFAGIVFESLSL